MQGERPAGENRPNTFYEISGCSQATMGTHGSLSTSFREELLFRAGLTWWYWPLLRGLRAD
jgi:hypothetical protein